MNEKPNTNNKNMLIKKAENKQTEKSITFYNSVIHNEQVQWFECDCRKLQYRF